MTEQEKLIQFAFDSKDINPNLINDVWVGVIRPCGVVYKVMECFYRDSDERPYIDLSKNTTIIKKGSSE